MNKKTCLINDIANEMNLDYISDLLYSVHEELFKQVILQIPDQQYTLDEWNDVINYIVGFPLGNINDTVQAKAFLLQYPHHIHSR